MAANAKRDNGIIVHDEKAPENAIVSFKEVVYNDGVVVPIVSTTRLWLKIIVMLKYLERQPAAQENYHAVIKEEMETLLKQAKKAGL